MVRQCGVLLALCQCRHVLCFVRCVLPPAAVLQVCAGPLRPAGHWRHVSTLARYLTRIKLDNGLFDVVPVPLLTCRFAQDRCAKLDMRRHHVLKSVHPSPLSAHRVRAAG